MDFLRKAERSGHFGAVWDGSLQFHYFPAPAPRQLLLFSLAATEPQEAGSRFSHFYATVFLFPETQHLKFKSYERCSKEHQLFIFLVEVGSIFIIKSFPQFCQMTLTVFIFNPGDRIGQHTKSLLSISIWAAPSINIPRGGQEKI